MSASVADGELKSKIVENPINGDAAVVATESGEAVANSQTCHSNGERSTAAIDLVKVAQSLQIMRDCVDMVHDSGVATEFAPFISKSGKPCVIVVLQGVELLNDDFVYAPA